MKFTLIAAAFVGSTQAWWGDGHILVAKIAQDFLEKNSPATLATVLDVLKPLKANDAGYTKYEDKHPFVECANMADKIKHMGGDYQSGWHFIDSPLVDQKGKTIKDYTKFIPDALNVT